MYYIYKFSESCSIRRTRGEHLVRIDYSRKTDRQKFPSSGGVAKIQRIFDGVVIDTHPALNTKGTKFFLKGLGVF